MGDEWSTDDLRLSDPDAFPGGTMPARRWSADAEPLSPSDGQMMAPKASTRREFVAFAEQQNVPGEMRGLQQPEPARVPARGSRLGKKGGARRGALGVVALTSVLVGTLVGAGLLYKAVSSVNLISRDPIGNGLLWLTGWIGMDVLITAGLVLAVVALFRGSRRGLAGISLVIGVFVAPLFFLGALQLGVNVVQDRAREQLRGTAQAAEASVVEYADQHGIDLGPFRPILGALLDDGR